MEFPFNISLSQAPDDVFSLLNYLIASGTANADENADFSGIPPESSVPCSPTRHANAQQPSLVNGEIIGRESQVWNPYSTLPPLSICPSAPTTEEPPLSTCPSALTTEESPSDDVAPTVPATEDENYALDLELLWMADLDPTYDVCNPYSDQHIGDSNERSIEIVGDVWENHFMDVGTMSYFYGPYSDMLPLHTGQLDERQSEIVSSVPENHCRVGQSQQIDYLSGLTTGKPSSEAMASTNSTVLAVENGQSTSICQPILPSDWQMMASPLAFPAFGFPSSTSYCPLGFGFRQNDIVHSGHFDGGSPRLGNRGESHENLNFRYQEVDHGKKKKKLNDGRRRCSCTKSKCIQLYCECFSSGIFCDEACGCKGCFNTVEHGTLVLNKRTEIEKRNSLAFASKTVPLHQEDSELHGIQLSIRKRQKRGCSCTKSKCLQKYCECYQANVKCSAACRCKGCGNRGTHEHNSGLENFMIGESMNINVDTHGFYRNGGEMLPQTEANNISIGRQPRLSSIPSVLPLQQWQPRESTSYGNSLSSYPTFGPRPLPPMNFYEVPANHNGTPLILNDSHLPVRVNSPYRNRVPQPRFPVPEAGFGMSTRSLPPPHPHQ